MAIIIHTLSYADWGLKFAVNLDSPLDQDKTWASSAHIYRMLYVSFCLDLANKYISFKKLLCHLCSALGHRHKCRRGGGLLEADKTKFVFLAFEVFPCLIKPGWMACTANRLVLMQGTCGTSHTGLDRWKVWYPAYDNSSHRSLLWYGTLSSAPALSC